MNCPQLMTGFGGFFSLILFSSLITGDIASIHRKQITADSSSHGSQVITLFLCGDVMTGRGIDQVLHYPSDPVLHEPYVKNARVYVKLAEDAHGPIQQPVDPPYIWGEALDELERISPDARIINLETSITGSDDFQPGKGIHYRMHPKNVPCLTAAGVDICVLANNHILDWDFAGLRETVETLEQAGIRSAGAGLSRSEAEAPAVLEVEERCRVLVFSYGTVTSGIPLDWSAAEDKPGVNVLKDLSSATAGHLKAQISKVKRDRDIVVISIHWGGNWGYDIPAKQRRFAHQLIDEAGVDIIHGHSSHHVKGIEVYRGKLILYGCGDFINDYEGISGQEAYRADLGLMYFPSVDPSDGRLLRLEMTPTRIRNFSIHRADPDEARWLRDMLNREGRSLGTRVQLNEDRRLTLQWD